MSYQPTQNWLGQNSGKLSLELLCSKVELVAYTSYHSKLQDRLESKKFFSFAI